MNMPRHRPTTLLLALACSLSGCVSYQAAPLALASPLHPNIAALNRRLPDGRDISLTTPLTVQQVASLALLNDPELIAARTGHQVAQAELLGAGLPPDPSITAGFDALISGPGSVPAIAASLTQDLSAVVTYRLVRRGAAAGLAQADAGILWQEWQVAAAAMQLCITITGDDQIVASLLADQSALTRLSAVTQQQVAAKNLTIEASSSSMAALAANAATLSAASQTLVQDRDQLDALLALQPGIAIAVTFPEFPATSGAAAQAAIASLPYRRPDLIALRYGYAQADARLRAAILTQFLPISLGGTGGRDTSNVTSAGPQITLTLPLFNHDRAGIAGASATRAALAAQFQASLASATGGAEALLPRIATLQAQAAAAAQQAQSAAAITASANFAFANGAVDAQSAAGFQTAAADRERAVIALNIQLQTAKLSLAALLGLGLPAAAPVQPEILQ